VVDRVSARGVRVTLAFTTPNSCRLLTLSTEQFALTEASYVLVRLLQVYIRLESRGDEPFCERVAISISNYNGTKVSLRKE
jgi:hypothetical protein